MVFHPITLKHFKDALDTFTIWFLPGSLSFEKRLALSFLTITGLLWLTIALRRKFNNRRKGFFSKEYFGLLSLCYIVFIFFYSSLLIVSISLFDAQIPINSRILSPIFVFGSVPILCRGYALFQTREKMPLFNLSKNVTGMVVILVFVMRAANWFSYTDAWGLGYSGKAWRNSKCIEYIRKLDPKTPIFTNGSDVVYFFTGRHTNILPPKISPGTLEIAGSYSHDMAKMKKALMSGGILVYFDAISWTWYLPQKEEIMESMQLKCIVNDDVGKVYLFDDQID
jgi:hypothetical protein